jgi:hypothetical protein
MAAPGDGGPWGWRPLGMADPGDGGLWGWRTLGMAAPGEGEPWGWRTGTYTLASSRVGYWEGDLTESAN